MTDQKATKTLRELREDAMKRSGLVEAVCTSIVLFCLSTPAHAAVVDVFAAASLVPASVWVMVSGLLGLVGVARRNK
jgi:hypothetical protein